MKSCGTVRTGVPWRMRLGKWRAGIGRSFVCCFYANAVVVVLFLLGLGMFLPSLKAEKEAESATVLVEEGRPELIVHFSSFINTNGRTLFILNAKNIGSRPAAVRQKLHVAGFNSGGLSRMWTTTVISTNAGWTVIPATRSVQIPFEPGWGISIWSNETTYTVYISYRDAKDTNIAKLEAGRSYTALCELIPNYAPAPREANMNAGRTKVSTGDGNHLPPGVRPPRLWPPVYDFNIPNLGRRGTTFINESVLEMPNPK